MKILLVTRPGVPEADRFTCNLGEMLAAEGHLISYAEPITGVLKTDSSLFDEGNKPDLVVIIGGDGTILLSVQRMKIQVPVLGINWGEVGFLADLEPNEAFSFIKENQNQFKVEPRMRISISIDGRVVGEALNEALIVTEQPAKMLRFLIYIDSVQSERFRADGLLISTPTGSTAHAMSAGGPIIDPKIEEFLLVPMAPFMLYDRPHLIHSERSLQITLEKSKPATLVIDGQKRIPITTDVIIDVKKSDQPALFVDTGKNFFLKFNDKLRHL